MKSLKEQILEAVDVRLEPLLVPEWNVTVWIPVLSAADALEMAKIEAPDHLLKTAVFAPRNEDGTRIFADSDVESLAKKSARAIERVVDKYLELNGRDAEKKSASPPISAGG